MLKIKHSTILNQRLKQLEVDWCGLTFNKFDGRSSEQVLIIVTGDESKIVNRNQTKNHSFQLSRQKWYWLTWWWANVTADEYTYVCIPQLFDKLLFDLSKSWTGRILLIFTFPLVYWRSQWRTSSLTSTAIKLFLWKTL